MSKLEIRVTDELGGARLDKALVALVEGASRARVKRALENAEVRVNGRVRAKGELVAAGDVITLEDAAMRSSNEAAVAAPEATLVVRYASDGVLIVDKPAGQPTAPQRAGETGTLANALVGHYPELAGIGYSPREPGIVHRLDTDTSGLVVVGRTAQAFEDLKEALQAERIQKEYLVICASEEIGRAHV